MYDGAASTDRPVVSNELRSIALTSDSTLLPTGESYVAVTGHWIDRTPCEKAAASLIKWRLVSAVLAVSVDNGKSIF